VAGWDSGELIAPESHYSLTNDVRISRQTKLPK
jgi:hypothetical protein